MAREIRGRFSEGKIEPLEMIDLKEGDEVIITLPEENSATGAFERVAGGWRGLVDTDALLKDFKESRKVRAPEVRL